MSDSLRTCRAVKYRICQMLQDEPQRRRTKSHELAVLTMTIASRNLAMELKSVIL